LLAPRTPPGPIALEHRPRDVHAQPAEGVDHLHETAEVDHGVSTAGVLHIVIRIPGRSSFAGEHRGRQAAVDHIAAAVARS
jgi:hypothetical protein